MIYQPFEVDSAAQPRGGLGAFNTFLMANLRKPITAQVSGAGGIVVLTGVVGTNGHISDVRITKNFRPDCDREAMRVFKLFNAWKPAKKRGEVVHQQVSMPIIFKPNVPLRYIHGEVITYQDADLIVLPDSNERVKFKEVNPVDTNGVPSGDLVLYKLANMKWEEYARDSLVHRLNEQPDSFGRPTYTIGHQQALLKLNGSICTVDATGKLLSEANYKIGKLAGPQIAYHPNGAVAKKHDYGDDKQVILSWYANGQIQQVQELVMGDVLETSEIDKVTAFWDSAGRQLVRNGTGWAQYYRSVKSYTNKNRETLLVEQGHYQDYLKQGTWTGIYADGSYFYEENYDKGVLLTGKSCVAGQDTTLYELEDRHPIFSGGMPALKQFLDRNLSYPISAQKDRVSGQVVVSFVVCTDGTLCDYVVTQSIRADLDREALRVVKKMSGRWIPGIQRGKKVQVKYYLPINFNLD
ncbi:TonB family protein [Spirosoma aerolatum]|uniref:TonB family protein n=1 Tax=Spirosoma aerolatum TaxID=1211326 RepID=UPI0014762617|nr:TonB family protein [Spirosoma aerolatum]